MASIDKQDICALDARTLQQLVKDQLVISRKLRGNKEELMEYILDHSSVASLQSIQALANEKAMARELKQTQNLTSRKRKRADEQCVRRTAIKLDDEPNTTTGESANFLELPSKETVRRCYRDFYEATGNERLKMMVCGVCALELCVSEVEMQTIRLSNVPNQKVLVPATAHESQVLFDGMLLESAGICQDANGETTVHICRRCLEELRKNNCKPPRHSLANGLWLGQIPWELARLSFPGQMLIALLYPRVYVFKLYTKTIHQPDLSCLQRAMRGTVTTYALNGNAITSMIRGDLLPRPLSLLSRIITVTFIGSGKLQLDKIRHLFRIRRQVVLEALVWLKAHNRKYYGEIDIDMQRIGALPEDDVPLELQVAIRQSEDATLIDREEAGYVPDHQVSQDKLSGDDLVAGDADGMRTVDGDDSNVIPLQVAGMIDTDLCNVTANEILTSGLANLCVAEDTEAYAVRHSHHPVNDFGNQRSHGVTVPNFFEQAFPCLYPFGCGGIESEKPIPLSFKDHVQWSLQYFDRRFRKHETFPFVAFGILQRRQALGSARLQVNRTTFERDGRTIKAITREQLEQAANEEDRGQRMTDPAVRLLRNSVYGACGRVMGSNQSRYQMRSQIWSTSAYLGPPSLWITINPSDLHDPIAQIFAGEKIDLDAFVESAGPDNIKRAHNIAQDPYAASKFFHFLINVMFDTLFKIKVEGHRVKASMGVFGMVRAYIGLVESQGRGTLHLHLLLWLASAPTGDEMHELLKTENFQARVVAYIEANLRAYVPGLESEESVRNIPVNREIAYSRPPCPDVADYEEQLCRVERQLARAEQVHSCRLRRCLLADKHGKLICKRRAPFQCAAENFVLENGEWGPKRLYEFMNGWVPAILINCRCNNDGKLLTNGEDTKNVTYYVTAYAAKKQGKIYNLAAVIAQGYAYHNVHPNPDYVDSIRDESRLLIFRLIHAINREQELAAVMVMSYLMGWGDVFRSHSYSPIYWSSFVVHLLQNFPELIEQSRYDVKVETCSDRQQPKPSHVGENVVSENDIDDSSGNGTVILDIDSAGIVFPKSQATDYRCRGAELENYNIIDFFVDTYEIDKSPTEDKRSVEGVNDSTHSLGRPKHLQVHYLPAHPKYEKKVRMVRMTGHRNLPDFVGRYFPRRDDEETRDFYCACMLLLLKPWRNIQSDLKNETESWQDALAAFVDKAEHSLPRVLSNIQYFHDCSRAASLATERGDSNVTDERADDDDASETRNDEEGQLLSTEASPLDLFGDGGVQGDSASSKTLQNEVHGRLAIEIAKQVKLFPEDNSTWSVKTDNPVQRAIEGFSDRVSDWNQEMESEIARRTEENIDNVNAMQVDEAGVESLLNSQKSQGLDSIAILARPPLPIVDANQLDEDQLRAYTIIIRHLRDTLQGKEMSPLRMILYGEGGTGKSRVIETVSQAFDNANAGRVLVKAAYTGIAASLIGGQTTHNIASISIKSDGKISPKAKQKLQKFWRDKRYLIIDEFSMISKSFLARLSKNISIGKQASESNQNGISFGGINVILCGDLHQFPPVARGYAEHLFRPTNMSKDNTECQIGRMLYEEFSTIVMLRKQMRVTDPLWQNLLTSLRHGEMQTHHLDLLRELIITKENVAELEKTESPWTSATLVTPRHSVRTLWNEQALRNHCRRQQQPLFVCSAEDRIGKKKLTTAEQRIIALREKKANNGRNQQSLLEIAKGMKILLTANLQTELDIANGATGEIFDIILHPDEPPISNEPVIHLRYLPAYILVKLSRTRAPQLKGLPQGIIPIQPITTQMTIQLPNDIARTVRRTQYPITGAYAITDYRAQGQTMCPIIADIASPPSGSLSLFNLYVALSRSKGRSTIRLLRDFEDNLFVRAHDEQLLEEDERLERLDRNTKGKDS